VNGVNNVELLTTIMQYFIGVLLALLPALIWGYVFYKKSAADRKTAFLSFFAGLFSVAPILLYQEIWSHKLKIGSLSLQHINIFRHIEKLTQNPSWENFLFFVAVSVLVALGIYLFTAIATFIIGILSGETKLRVFERTLARSLEEPLLFISLGVFVGLLAYFFNLSLERAIWYYLMVGAMEEFSKHLVVRFMDDGKYRGVDDVILYSIMVALGFAFLENIIYFIDRIWLSACSFQEIQAKECLLNPKTGQYIHQVGILLFPFVFRSLFSTLAHVCFSGVFGYFYGLAYFATQELKQAQEKSRGYFLVRGIAKIFNLKGHALFHQQQIILGVFVAIVLHMIFDVILEWNAVYLIVPYLVAGYLLLGYLLKKKRHQVEAGEITERRTTGITFGRILQNIEILKRFEKRLESRIQAGIQADAERNLPRKATVLEKFEQDSQKRGLKKSLEQALPERVKTLERFETEIKKRTERSKKELEQSDRTKTGDNLL